jgi:hypothetical protein
VRNHHYAVTFSLCVKTFLRRDQCSQPSLPSYRNSHQLFQYT